MVTEQHIWQELAQVADPEIPTLSITEMGISGGGGAGSAAPECVC
jgi:metal-sulfur cluster biosynthetic enzyme